MPRRVRQPLTTRRVKAIKDQGMYADGGCLYLRVYNANSKSWVLRTVVFGKRCDLGLGPAEFVSLKEARELAFEMRKIARQGGDPRTLRQQGSLTFEEAARRTLEAQKAKWSSDKHATYWWSTLERYVLPKLGRRPLETIQTVDIHPILETIWATKYDTAKRIKQRIGLVFDWAKGAGHFHGENPVTALSKALPKVQKRVSHRAALKWRDLPDFMVKLARRDDLSARLMEVAILTCVRSKEVRGIRWEEIEGDTWIIPADRMKERLPHRVPLAKQVRAILSSVPKLDHDFVFPSPNGTRDGNSREMSDMVFAALMKRMGVEGVTMHGFRSTFKDWCTENAAADWELSEMALAHKVGTAVERAYARSDLIGRRRELMQSWADFALSKVEGRSGIPAKPNQNSSKVGRKRVRRIEYKR